MPRNGSGTFTLAQPAFVPGTTISSSAVNSDLSDIASALTQSYSADGQTPLTGQIKAQSGTVGAPGISFSSNTGTGFYLAGANQIGVTTAGGQAVTFNSDRSTTFVGATTFTGAQTFNGNSTITGGTLTINSPTWVFGAGAANGFWNGAQPTISLNMVIDGAGSTITTGVKGYLWVPFACTITQWSILADQSGSITVDVLGANSFTIPSVSIVGGGNKPNSTGQGGLANVSGWTTTALTAGFALGFNVTACASYQRVTLQLMAVRTGN